MNINLALTFMLLTLAVWIWPLLIPSAWLVWKRRVIGRKTVFWIGSVLAGYILMYGALVLANYAFAHFGGEGLSVEFQTTLYWYLLVIAMAVLIPFGSTWFLYSKLRILNSRP